MINFNDDTLLHAIGFNPMRLESILKYGIVSYNYAKEHNIPYSKNYNFTISKTFLKDNEFGENTNEILKESNYNNIYLVRMLYVSDDPLSAYNLYVTKGISLVVEDIDFISDKTKEFIKRSDEVIVKRFIPKENIKGISIPKNYIDESLLYINILPDNIKNYEYIMDTVKNYVTYLEKYNHKVDIEELSILLKDFKYAAKSIASLEKDSIDYKESMEDYKDIIKEIDELLVLETNKCFTKILGPNPTVGSLVEYINSKYDNKEIIMLENGTKKYR